MDLSQSHPSSYWAEKRWHLQKCNHSELTRFWSLKFSSAFLKNTRWVPVLVLFLAPGIFCDLGGMGSLGMLLLHTGLVTGICRTLEESKYSIMIHQKASALILMRKRFLYVTVPGGQGLRKHFHFVLPPREGSFPPCLAERAALGMQLWWQNLKNINTVQKLKYLWRWQESKKKSFKTGFPKSYAWLHL